MSNEILVYCCYANMQPRPMELKPHGQTALKKFGLITIGQFGLWLKKYIEMYVITA